jgi:hypothetical protein
VVEKGLSSNFVMQGVQTAHHHRETSILQNGTLCNAIDDMGKVTGK